MDRKYHDPPLPQWSNFGRSIRHPGAGEKTGTGVGEVRRYMRGQPRRAETIDMVELESGMDTHDAGASAAGDSRDEADVPFL